MEGSHTVLAEIYALSHLSDVHSTNLIRAYSAVEMNTKRHDTFFVYSFKALFAARVTSEYLCAQ
jgi:hypothetical protein